MKLTTQPIQIRPDSNPDSVVAILPPAIRFLRLTLESIEIAHMDALGSPRVARICGNGLDRLWQDLVFNRLHKLSIGLLAPHIGVTAIRPKERSLALTKNYQLSEPEKCRGDCFTLENGYVRDLWSADSLVGFAIHHTRQELLLQFQGVAYICTPCEGEFAEVRDRILADNLSTRGCPLWTVWGASWRPSSYTGKFYHFAKITIVERDISGNGGWDVRKAGPAAGGPGTQGRSVGFDI